MNIPVIINYKTRTGLAVKYPMGKIEEVILQEGKTLIGTCGDCGWWNHADKDKQSEWKECQQFDYGRPGGCVELKEFYTRKNFGCTHWKEKEK